VLSLAAGLVAQSGARVVPDSATRVEGSTSSAFPFAYTHGRTQQIFRGSAITSATGVINVVTYRRDVNFATGNFAAQAYTAIDLQAGVTTIAPEQMSTSFAANITGVPTQVLSGNYNLPALSALPSGPAPFSIVFALTTPLVFNAASGNLLLDLTSPQPAVKSGYAVDAEYASGSGAGRVNPFGTGGQFSRPEVYKLSANPSTLAPGGTLDIFCSSFTNNYAGTLVLGLSATFWGAIPLPLDLGVLGAPNNSLQVSMNLQLPFNTNLSSRNYISQLQAPIPQSNLYSGLTFFAQAYYLDGQANAAGLVATEGLSLTTDSTQAAPETNMVGHWDFTASTGSWLVNGKPAGPVVQFLGSL
jgi:hypothetical protein